MPAALSSDFTPDRAAVPAPVQPHEGSVQRLSMRTVAGGHDWYLDRYTRPASRPRPLCVLLHGTGASAASWEPMAHVLAQRFDIVAPDLPAHARTRTSNQARLDIGAQAQALDDLLAALRCEPQVLIGHSAGAVILTAWALRRSRRTASATADADATTRMTADTSVTPAPGMPALIALNGALLPLEGPAGWLFQPLARLSSTLGFLPRLFALRAAREPDHVERLLGGTGSAVDPAMVARYRDLLADGAHVAGVLRMMAAWDLHGFARELASAQTPRPLPVHTSAHTSGFPPLHLFAGDGDRTIPLRHAYRLHALLPNSTLDVLPGLGHLAHEEAPARLAEAVLNRLDQPDPGR